MKGRWESNINVWFRFTRMYSQWWNYAVSLFPKQTYNVLSPSFQIFMLMYIWEWGCAVSFLGIHKSDFRYSAWRVLRHAFNAAYVVTCLTWLGCCLGREAGSQQHRRHPPLQPVSCNSGTPIGNPPFPPPHPLREKYRGCFKGTLWRFEFCEIQFWLDHSMDQIPRKLWLQL
jgi:hypothetical protein